MGNSEIKTSSISAVVGIKDFRQDKVIGKGGFGKVWKTFHKSSARFFAMKEMSKMRVVKKNSVQSVMNERLLLSILKHPFLVNMQYAFQDQSNLYLVMDLMPGGDLRYHLSRAKTFTEVQTKFIISCILMGLEYLHINGVIHRDIKPENLVFDNKGYIRITDFGIASKIRKDNSKDTSGTPGYMSPEVMTGKVHSIETDYFALGVIAFECMLGRRPYIGRTRKEIREQMMIRQVQLKKNDVPAGWTLEAADFVNKLIQRNPTQRLGSNGPQDVKNHSWLSDVQWRRMYEKRIESPCKFGEVQDFKIRGLESWNEESEGGLEFVQNYFVGYNFDSNSKFVGDESTLEKKISN